MLSPGHVPLGQLMPLLQAQLVSQPDRALGTTSDHVPRGEWGSPVPGQRRGLCSSGRACSGVCRAVWASVAEGGFHGPRSFWSSGA